jgi:hypothetical protein
MAGSRNAVCEEKWRQVYGEHLPKPISDERTKDFYLGNCVYRITGLPYISGRYIDDMKLLAGHSSSHV